MSRGSGAATDLSRTARTLEISPTVAMAQRAAARRAQGKDVLDFSVGEPDQPTPAHVVAAATRALDAGRTRYAPAAGVPELRTAVANRYRADFGSPFATEEVAITVGGKQALYLACRALLGPGDEMVIPTPHWPTFSEGVRLAGAKPVLVRTREKEGFAVTARLIAKGLTSKTKAVLVNSPSNPTGAVIAPEEMRKVLALAKRRKFTVIYDDTYAQLTYGPGGPLRLEGLRELAPDRLVVLGTVSKTYCMTGLAHRLGAGTEGPGGRLRRLRLALDPGAGHVRPGGAAEALNGPQDLVPRMRAEYQKRRDAMLPFLSSIPGVTCVRPQGAFYFFPNVSKCLNHEVPDHPRPGPAPARRDRGGGGAGGRVRGARLPADLLRALAAGAGGRGATHRELPRLTGRASLAEARRPSFDSLGLARGTPVVLYLQEPKEKVWGLLIGLETSGVVVRGLDLQTFDDWMRQEPATTTPSSALHPVLPDAPAGARRARRDDRNRAGLRRPLRPRGGADREAGPRRRGLIQR